ncbi:hypothetical protein CROQUDRAFT_653036 [Cronartium quercuum f. sp. fusiforme G11]|uniref:Aldehyde dehydrogenase n=1 Tax=Cronartium quercuum f. sp. fusiforme G11 TaxID=708437 RepID=A0A9P6TF45_9BASI|nr:hypothetical protein CROQUDRAFT_653036 [Cronartium quercuum f. sp. fusiforme G11]
MSNLEIDQLNSSFTPVEEIPKIHHDLHKAFSGGVTKKLEWRTHQLKQLSYLLQENEMAFEEALAHDLGRPKTESHIGELVGVRHQVHNALSNLKSWLKPQNVKTDLTWLIARPKTYREPKGLVLIIGTWNYPVALTINPLIGAIAGGNAVMLKLSEQSPAVANLLTVLIPRYLDSKHICVINGTIPQTTTLLGLHFDHIFFTGSINVGRIIAKAAAETLTPVTLELGGKSPAIVFDDADFAVTGRRLIWAKVMNAGQTCVAPDHLLVSKESEPKLIESLKQAIRDFYPPAPAPNGRQSSRIVNASQLERLKGLLRDTSGEVVATGLGKAEEELGFPLTIVRKVTSEDALMRDEIFGPILPILTYDSVQDVFPPIARAEPLALYVFTSDDRNFELVREQTKSGQLVRNDLLIQFAIPGLPFGGVGKSVFCGLNSHFFCRATNFYPSSTGFRELSWPLLLPHLHLRACFGQPFPLGRCAFQLALPSLHYR